jgi:hypothetical protein
LTPEEIRIHYDEVKKSLGPYTKLHIEVIKIIVPEMEKHLEGSLDVKGLSKYYCFGADFLIDKSGFDSSIVFEILNDLIKDGLLIFSARLPETIVYFVTERGIYCLKKLIS